VSRPAELLPLGPGYGDLYDRLEAARAEQPGFIALTFRGSVLSGDADVYSDLDLVVEATDPATFDAPAASPPRHQRCFVEHWPHRLEDATLAHLRRELDFEPG
jgi:hypothetical protein